jgi:hypothetical protein
MFCCAYLTHSKSQAPYSCDNPDGGLIAPPIILPEIARIQTSKRLIVKIRQVNPPTKDNRSGNARTNPV